MPRPIPRITEPEPQSPIIKKLDKSLFDVFNADTEVGASRYRQTKSVSVSRHAGRINFSNNLIKGREFFEIRVNKAGNILILTPSDKGLRVTISSKGRCGINARGVTREIFERMKVADSVATLRYKAEEEDKDGDIVCYFVKVVSGTKK